MQASDEKGLTYAQAGAVTFLAKNTNFEVSSAGDLVAIDGAARAAVVFPYPDVERTGRAADVDGRALLALEAVHTVGAEAQTAKGHRAVGELALSLGLAFEGVPELVRTVVSTDWQIVFLENVRNFGVEVIG